MSAPATTAKPAPGAAAPVEDKEKEKKPTSLLESMSKKQKLAALLVTMGPELGATILNEFDESDVEEISTEMIKLDFVSPMMQRELLHEFSGIILEAVASSAGGPQFAKVILEKAIGSYKANEVINRVAPNRVHTIDTMVLRDIPPRQILNLLRKEQIQTWALVLSYLEPARCAEVLSLLNPEFRSDVVERIATMEPTPSEVVEQVLLHIQRRSSLRNQQDVTSSGGIQILASVINTLDDATSKQVLASLEERNPDLCRSVKKLLFTFEDMAELDKSAIGKMLREVDFHILAVALKTASEKLKGIIFGALTKRAAEAISEEIEFMPPVRLAEVEEAQEQIIEQLRKLEANGEIVLNRGGDKKNAVV
ncbi:MAG: flagellar motor switch protein FliG [Verrucomicrobiota bacterium]